MLRKVVHIRDGDPDNEWIVGFFEPPTHKKGGKLRVAILSPAPTALHTLCHEFVHFLQWREDREIYKEENYAILEAATEKEALRLIKKFQLPIDINARNRASKKYIRKLQEEEKKL